MATRDHSASLAAVHRSNHPLLTRKERSRDLAQKRRSSFKSLMTELADHIPLSKDVVGQMDHNSRLRVALSFLRMKMFMMAKSAVAKETKKNAAGGGGLGSWRDESSEMKGVEVPSEVVQELMTEALDGFMVVTQLDGDIIYISENVHAHLGLFHSEYIGGSLYDMVTEDDHEELKTNLAKIEAETLCKRAEGPASVSFFCRMKCSRFKVSNATKSSGYKLVFISGQPSITGSDHFFVAMVKLVTPPAILGMRSEYNMFVTHYALDMKCTFFDGRLQHLHGFSKGDLIGHVPFEFHHHDDLKITLQCSQGLIQKGEGLSGYYRHLTHHGNFMWVQSRATMIYDNRTGNPSYIVCVNFVISDDIEQPQLTLSQAITGSSELSFVHHPFPISRGDGETVNPLDADNNEIARGDIEPPKRRGSLAEEPSSSGAVLTDSPAGSSPLKPLLFSVPLQDSMLGPFLESSCVEAPLALPDAPPPPPPPLSPLSDSGYSSLSFWVNPPIGSSAPSPSPISNGSSTTSEHSAYQRPLTLDTHAPSQSPLSSCSSYNTIPPSTHPDSTPPSHHYDSSFPSPPQSDSLPSPVYSLRYRSSPYEAIASFAASVANWEHAENTPDSMCSHSSSPDFQNRMDFRQCSHTPPSGGLCDEDEGTGCSLWGCCEVEDEGTLPMLTQDDLNMLDLLEPMNTWA